MLRRLWRNRKGNVAMLVALGMTMLLGFAALGVDAGSLFLSKRKLQGIADAAALAAVATSDHRGEAQAAITASGQSGVEITALQTGTYAPDDTIAVESRFVPTAMDGNAVELRLRQPASLFFGRALLGRSSTLIEVKARAAKIDLAAFELGTRLVGLSGGLPNSLLSGLVGTNLNLSIMDYNALAGANVDALAFADSLRTQLRLTGVSYDQLLSTQVTLPQLVRALAAGTSDSGAKSVFNALALRVPELGIVPATLIDLGPMGADVQANGTTIALNAFSMLRESLTIAGGGRQVSLDLGVSVPGVASTTATVLVGNRSVQSPWVAVGTAGNVTIHTTQTRLLLDTRIAVPLLAQANVPIFVELARASATLTDVKCQVGRQPYSVKLAVTPAVAKLAIGAVDTSQFSNLNSPVAITPATILNVPIVISIKGKAEINVGGTTAQTVTFHASDIATHRTITVNTNDLTQGISTSLISGLQLQTTVLGIGVNTSAITTTLGTTLSGVAPALDGVLTQLTGLLGVGVGQADVRVSGVRCGMPILIG